MPISELDRDCWILDVSIAGKGDAWFKGEPVTNEKYLEMVAVRLLSRRPEETAGYGARLGALLKRGDTVCLFGDLGSGKTTFIKGVASALGIPERDITSASFTIIAEYAGTLRSETVPFFHIDLYRINSAEELDSLGIYEYIGRDGIAVIEWAERMDPVAGSLAVTFRIVDDNEREITVEGIDETDWHRLQERQV